MKIYFLVVMIICLSACAPSSKLAEANIEVKSQFQLPAIYAPNYAPFAYDVYTSNGKTLIYSIFCADNEQVPMLVSYDLESKKLVKIAKFDVSWRHKMGAYNMKVVNPDEIYVHFFTNPPPAFAEDSSLLLIDGNCRVLQVLSNKSMDISYEGIENLDATHSICYESSSEIAATQQSVIIPFRRPTIGYDSAAMKYPLPVVGALNKNSGEFSYFQDYTYPNALLRNPWPSEAHIPKVQLSFSNKALIHFGYTSMIWEWDYTQNTTQKHFIAPSLLMDSVKPIPIVNNRPLYGDYSSRETGTYLNITADALQNRYIWWLALPSDYYGTSPITGYPHCGFMILDANLKKIAEGKTTLPIIYTNPKKLNKEMFICADVEANRREQKVHTDSIHLNYLTFSIEISKNKRVDPMPKQKLAQREQEYFKKYYPKVYEEEKSVVVMSPLTTFCTTCRKTLEDFAFNEHQNLPMSWIYLGDNAQMDAPLQPTNKTTVYTDKQGHYTAYFFRPNEPIVYFLSKGQIMKKVNITALNEASVLDEIQTYLTP